MRIGVLGLQGAFTEHVDAVHAALASAGLEGDARVIRRPDALKEVDGVILPGGESTTISKLLVEFGLFDVLRERVEQEDFPVMGTCAGMVLLAKEGDGQVQKTRTRLLGVMDMAVDRNAFGRQRESFEADVTVKGFDSAFPAVFIRAPAVTRAWGACEAIGTLDDGAVVAVREGNRFAFAFHPELTPDARVHETFVRAVADWQG